MLDATMGEAPPDSFNKQDLSQLLRSTGLWRASGIDCDFTRATPTGFASLDAELPGNGWPAAGLSELLHEHHGIGEFRLILPGLARLSQTQGRWILMVNPPYIPYPPALLQAGVNINRIVVTTPGTERDTLWVLEKALGSQSCSAVLAWPEQIRSKQLRRLQVASKDGDCWGILFRAAREVRNPSPAELRIVVCSAEPHRDKSAITVKILKRRGGWESKPLTLHFDDELQRPMPDFSEMQISRNDPTQPDKVIEGGFSVSQRLSS